MRIISSLDAVAEARDSTLELWIYNGLDSAITREVRDEMRKKLEPSSELAYNFARGMLAPALEMMFRGVRIDEAKRGELIYDFKQKLERLDRYFNLILRTGFGRELNPRSVPQLKEFFYTFLGLEERKKYDKQTKEMVVTVDREALEDIAEKELIARPVCNLLMKMRDTKKLLDVAESGIRNGRMHCTYNVVGATTQRWSSSEDAFGSGTNLQNITDEMREMFIADPGKKLGYVDLSQAESVGTAYISGDEAYIKACTSGDLHTFVCRMIEPNLGWTGDIKKDREKAEEPFFRHYSRRDGGKACGHASNYAGDPYAIYKNLIAKGIYFELSFIRAFQELYYRAFPGILEWHLHVERMLAQFKYVENPFGYRLHFFGRTNDKTTIKAAIAGIPQSTIGQLLNLGLYRVWKARQVQILLQVHDCIIFQFDDNPEAERRAMRHVIETVRIPVPVRDIHGTVRTMCIQSDGATGWNWRARKTEKQEDGTIKIINEHGLKKYSPDVPDTRSAPSYSVLHRRVYQTY